VEHFKTKIVIRKYQDYNSF